MFRRWHSASSRLKGFKMHHSSFSSTMYGPELDIHSGGEDLRFPHHENELAQTQAYYCCSQWTNYWLHCGHLHLKNDHEKMSKSLKNYISVTDMLEKYTANQFRIFCLLAHYRNRKFTFGSIIINIFKTRLFFQTPSLQEYRTSLSWCSDPPTIQNGWVEREKNVFFNGSLISRHISWRLFILLLFYFPARDLPVQYLQKCWVRQTL
jgi:leucyl-tRNA synthetase